MDPIREIMDIPSTSCVTAVDIVADGSRPRELWRGSRMDPIREIVDVGMVLQPFAVLAVPLPCMRSALADLGS
ncbi:hypothetical protein AB1N83_013183 [Pleurotus pulmonarius]